MTASRNSSCICRRAEHVPEHRLVNCKDVTKRTLGVEIAAERALVARLLDLHEIMAFVQAAFLP